MRRNSLRKVQNSPVKSEKYTEMLKRNYLRDIMENAELDYRLQKIRDMYKRINHLMAYRKVLKEREVIYYFGV